MRTYNLLTTDGATEYFCEVVNPLDETVVHTVSNDLTYKRFQEVLRDTTDDDLIVEVLSWLLTFGEISPNTVQGRTLASIADNRGASSYAVDLMLTMNSPALELETYLASNENLTADQVDRIMLGQDSQILKNLAHNNYTPQASRVKVAMTTDDLVVHHLLLLPKNDAELRSAVPMDTVRAFDGIHAKELVSIAKLTCDSREWEDHDPTYDYSADLQAVLNQCCPEELVEIFMGFKDTIGEVARQKYWAEDYCFQTDVDDEDDEDIALNEDSDTDELFAMIAVFLTDVDDDVE